MPTRRAPRDADPTSDDALLAQPAKTAGAPDMPIAIARAEWTTLARLAGKKLGVLKKLGITAEKVASLARFAKQLKARERTWQTRKLASVRSASGRKLIEQAEAVRTKLLEAGDWACRNDEDGRAELAHIRQGTGLADLVTDLSDLGEFWSTRAALLATTLATPSDVALAGRLGEQLDEAATAQASDTDAATALELRNRCFWGGDAIASELRAAGRYGFSLQPKLAARFVSRHRAHKQHVHRTKVATPPNAPSATDAPASAPLAGTIPSKPRARRR